MKRIASATCLLLSACFVFAQTPVLRPAKTNQALMIKTEPGGKTLADSVADLQKRIQQLEVQLNAQKGLVPLAYAAFVPQLNPATNGYHYAITTKYGFTGEPVQSYSRIEITLERSISGNPVVVTSLAEDHINSKIISRVSVITYEFIPPNKLALTLRRENGETVIAPFSVVVYGTPSIPKIGSKN